MLKPIEKLSREIMRSFPKARCTLDPPEGSTGSWFLNVDCAGFSIVVEWRQGGLFGLNAGRDGAYGEGADETYPDLNSAARRVVWLLEHRTPTAPPLADKHILGRNAD